MEVNQNEAEGQATRRPRVESLDVKREQKLRIPYRFLLGGLLKSLAKLVGVLAGWLDKLA